MVSYLGNHLETEGVETDPFFFSKNLRRNGSPEGVPLACYRCEARAYFGTKYNMLHIGEIGSAHSDLSLRWKGEKKGMANMKKFSDMRDIGHLCAHYERSVEREHYGNQEIDNERLDEDRTNLAPDRGKQTAYIKEKIEEIMDGRTLRRDAIRMCCWIVDAPTNLPEERKEEFFQATYEFLVERYGAKSGLGEDVVISAYIHRSETTDHLHFAFLPVIDRNGEKTFCAKEAVGRNDLATFHMDLASLLESKGICKKSDILNGATKRDSSGRALSVRELKKNRIIERERKVDRWGGSAGNRERTIGRWD